MLAQRGRGGVANATIANKTIRMTLINETDALCLCPPYTHSVKSEVLNFGVPS